MADIFVREKTLAARRGQIRQAVVDRLVQAGDVGGKYGGGEIGILGRRNFSQSHRAGRKLLRIVNLLLGLRRLAPEEVKQTTA